MSASSSKGFSLAQDIEHGSILGGLSPSSLPEQVLVPPRTEPVMTTEADSDLMVLLAVLNRLEDSPLPSPVARRPVSSSTRPPWIIPQRRGIRSISPPVRPRHPIQSPDPAPHYRHFRPHDDLDEEERAASPPINVAAHVPQPSSPDDVHFQCRLLLPVGVRCTEWFFVAPNFTRSSPYGLHLAQVHLIDLSADKTIGPWVCTRDGCRSQQAITVGVVNAVAHIRTHLGHHVECPDCHKTYSRKSSVKRHREECCGSAEERARKRARTLPEPRSFDCQDCGRQLESADALFRHQMMQECAAGSSR